MVHQLSVIFIFAFACEPRSSDYSAESVDNPTSDFHWIDVDAFLNLVDPAEEEFLRKRLQSADFKAIQQQRLEAVLDYIETAARDAEILERMLETVRCNLDPSLTGLASKLIQEAARLRTHAFVSTLLPWARISRVKVAESYARLLRQASLLGLLHPPVQLP